MNYPLISIITACYNKDKFLLEAIDSVLSQSFQEFEWIFIDDGSTDNSAKIFLSQIDCRLKYYHISNQGQAAASNYGLNFAKGKYVKFFDADDIMNQNHLSEQFRLANHREDILVSCSWARFFDNDINTARIVPELVWRDLSSINWIKSALSQKSDMMPAWLWLIPTSLLKKVGGLDLRDSINNDFEFSMRLLLNVEEVKFACDAIMYYRSGNDSMSNTKSIVAFQNAIISNQLGCEHLLKIENTLETRRLCADRFQEWVFRIYPDDLNLVMMLESKIADLGGSSRKMSGGFLFIVFRTIFGWKNAKIIQRRLSILNKYYKNIIKK